MGENKEIKEATEKLDSLSEDERMQRIADLRLKAIMDEKAIYAKGLEDGKRKREEELQEKIAKMEERIETIAKKMLEQKIDKKIIAGLTGMTLEEIEKLN